MPKPAARPFHLAERLANHRRSVQLKRHNAGAPSSFVLAQRNIPTKQAVCQWLTSLLLRRMFRPAERTERTERSELGERRECNRNSAGEQRLHEVANEAVCVSHGP